MKNKNLIPYNHHVWAKQYYHNSPTLAFKKRGKKTFIHKFYHISKYIIDARPKALFLRK